MELIGKWLQDECVCVCVCVYKQGALLFVIRFIYQMRFTETIKLLQSGSKL